MNLPLTRAEAIATGSKFYQTNKACKNGHTAKRFTLNASCHQCTLDSLNKCRKKIQDTINENKEKKNG